MADPEPEAAIKIPLQETIPPSNPPVDEIKAQKMARLQTRIDAINAEIKAKSEKLEAVKGELKSPSAALTVKTHITLLHQYNEIRDIGQGLLGMVAENRGVRIGDLYLGDPGEFGVGRGD